MAISYIGGTSADTTTTSLPVGAAAGDLAIVVTARNNVSGSGIPLGWNDLGVISGGSGGTAHGQRVGWKLLEAADITAGDVGQWATAKTTQVMVYRGASEVGENNSGTGAAASTLTFPARSSLNSGSWVVAVGTHRTASDVDDLAATDYTNRSATFTATSSGGMDTNGAVSSVVQRTATVNASSGNAGRTMEVTEAAAPPAITGSGGLTAEATAISGIGEQTFAGSGGISAAATQIDADGSLLFIASGGIVAAATAVSGTGEVEDIGITGSGGLVADPTTIAADGLLSFIAEGGLSAPATQIAADGTVEELDVEESPGGGSRPKRHYVYVPEPEPETPSKPKKTKPQAITAVGGIVARATAIRAQGVVVPPPVATDYFAKPEPVRIFGSGSMRAAATSISGIGAVDLTPCILRDDAELLEALFPESASCLQ